MFNLKFNCNLTYLWYGLQDAAHPSAGRPLRCPPYAPDGARHFVPDKLRLFAATRQILTIRLYVKNTYFQSDDQYAAKRVFCRSFLVGFDAERQISGACPKDNVATHVQKRTLVP
jgi:hypothetical protein